MFFFFFFSSRRRHTRCLSDWSSDVCSSDLFSAWCAQVTVKLDVTSRMVLKNGTPHSGIVSKSPPILAGPLVGPNGRASGREKGEISGVPISLKKKIEQGKCDQTKDKKYR